jgi:hypothetical protein
LTEAGGAITWQQDQASALDSANIVAWAAFAFRP